MSGLGKAVGISMMLHERLEREAARDAQARGEAPSHFIRFRERPTRLAARADIAMMLRMMGKDRLSAETSISP